MSFWRLNYHLIWVTKNRFPYIDSQTEELLFPYITQKAFQQNAIIYAINGVEDHIHTVLSIPPSLAISDYVKNIKGSSSHYLNTEIFHGSFAWSRGYGIFSLGERQRNTAIDYVRNQKLHHKQNTTNPWLEKYLDDEEELHGIETQQFKNNRTIADINSEYIIDDSMPF